MHGASLKKRGIFLSEERFSNLRLVSYHTTENRFSIRCVIYRDGKAVVFRTFEHISKSAV